jgi:hypothetical protein
LSWKDTTAQAAKQYAEESSVVGIDYEVRMELIAQPWAAVELLSSSSLPHSFLEDINSLSDESDGVQLKKSIDDMR